MQATRSDDQRRLISRRGFLAGVCAAAGLAARGRGDGWRWGAPTANDPATVEALQYMIDLRHEGLSASSDVGGGGTVQGLFASNHFAMTIGGGFWADGLHAAGMAPGQFDVQYFPGWSGQKHLLGDAGYAMLKTLPPLGLVTLQGYLGTGSVSVVLAGVILSLIPTLIVFLVAQRRLVEGLTFGSVKG